MVVAAAKARLRGNVAIWIIRQGVFTATSFRGVGLGLNIWPEEAHG